MKKPIYSCYGKGPVPIRMFDVVVEGDKVELEVKRNKQFERIPWDDVVRQVNAATQNYKAAANE